MAGSGHKSDDDIDAVDLELAFDIDTVADILLVVQDTIAALADCILDGELQDHSFADDDHSDHNIVEGEDVVAHDLKLVQGDYS